MAVESDVHSFMNYVTCKTPENQQENGSANGEAIATIMDDDSIELPTYDWSKSEEPDDPSNDENEKEIIQEESTVGFGSSENGGMQTFIQFI